MTIQEKTNGKIRYAVAGIGHIAQVAVLPAFRHARNSELVALVSSDQEKLDVLGKKYDVERCVTYDDYDALMASGDVDAVYIALPNEMHCEFTERAAKHGVHVLCEKPMAVNEAECRRMITACENAGVKLMIAYRLHFDEANLEAIEMVRDGKIGDAKYFSSIFSFDVNPGDIRLGPTRIGGGPLHDIGIYCINAVRHLFQDEPLDVMATSLTGNDPKFKMTQEQVAVTMRFPEYRLASFIVSYSSDHQGAFRIVGTKGTIELDPAYGYSEPMTLKLCSDSKVVTTKDYKKSDQFAPELIYFSECITQNQDPEPDGDEGLADIRIIEGILQSIESSRVVKLGDFPPVQRPTKAQAMRKRPVREPKLVGVEAPHD